MRPYIGEDEDEVFEETFSPHYPIAYILKTWFEHKEYGLYPRAGGYDDQDDLLMQDWDWVSRAYAQAQDDYEDLKKPAFGQKLDKAGGGFNLDMIRGMG